MVEGGRPAVRLRRVNPGVVRTRVLPETRFRSAVRGPVGNAFSRAAGSAVRAPGLACLLATRGFVLRRIAGGAVLRAVCGGGSGVLWMRF